MFTMDSSILKLYQEGKIDRETSLLSCSNYDAMIKRI